MSSPFNRINSIDERYLHELPLRFTSINLPTAGFNTQLCEFFITIVQLYILFKVSYLDNFLIQVDIDSSDAGNIINSPLHQRYHIGAQLTDAKPFKVWPKRYFGII